MPSTDRAGRANVSNAASTTTRKKAKPAAKSAKAATTAAKPKAKARTKPARKAAAKPVTLPEGYRPSDDEEFMNERQRAYFRAKLEAWRDDIIRQTRATIEGLTVESSQHADIADRATSETDRALELRARDRQRKLVGKIDAALKRIDDESYGYCEDTGDPISLRRLEARPIATLSIEAQERHERREKVYRED